MTNESPDAPAKHDQCIGVTKSGAQCRARALPGARFCVSHDPARVADLAEWRRQGGRAKSNKERARKALPGEVLTPIEIQGVLSKALKDVIGGELEPGRANAAASIAKSLLAVKEATELEDRLAALESAAGIDDRRRA